MKQKKEQQQIKKKIRQEEKQQQQRRALMERIARAAAKFEHSKRLWSDKDRNALFADYLY